MRPYIELGLTFVSGNHVLTRVGAWTAGMAKGKGVHGAIYQDKINGPHRIWLHTHYFHNDEILPFSKIDLLTLLAHEIAHMEDWKHTPKHKRLESRILSAFMKMLKGEGYESEEAELSS